MNPLLARGSRENFSAETEEYENGERSDAFVVLDPLPGILEKTGSIAMGDAFISKIHENADFEGQNHIVLLALYLNLSMLSLHRRGMEVPMAFSVILV